MFSIFLALLFFLNPISIALVLIGANLPDFDHDIKKNNLYKILIIGLIIFIILYIFKLPYYIGIILCCLPIIFYFSNHRGFTHSLLGITVLSILIFLIVISTSAILESIFNSFSIANSQFLALAIMIMGLAIMILNKKLWIPFIIIFSLAIILLLTFLPTISINTLSQTFHPILFNSFSSNNLQMNIFGPFTNNLVLIFFPIFLGLLSHLILDSVTPAGIELFRPFSSKKVHKKFAIISLFLVVLLAIGWWNFILFIL